MCSYACAGGRRQACKHACGGAGICQQLFNSFTKREPQSLLTVKMSHAQTCAPFNSKIMFPPKRQLKHYLEPKFSP